MNAPLAAKVLPAACWNEPAPGRHESSSRTATHGAFARSHSNGARLSACGCGPYPRGRAPRRWEARNRSGKPRCRGASLRPTLASASCPQCRVAGGSEYTRDAATVRRGPGPAGAASRARTGCVDARRAGARCRAGRLERRAPSARGRSRPWLAPPRTRCDSAHRARSPRTRKAASTRARNEVASIGLRRRRTSASRRPSSAYRPSWAARDAGRAERSSSHCWSAGTCSFDLWKRR